ncbi:threonine synthase [Histoplasma ohiense]|nr:threonine synthase [Histoplasma ohiense (nom. inval.)]
MSGTDSQRYLSTRGSSCGLSFEDVVLKGLASDGGLFIPEAIPQLPEGWESKWRDFTFQELAFEIMSLYISPSEIPPEDLKNIINRSYSTFRSTDVTPLVTLDDSKQLYLLELFCGPTFAFKDVALQFLGNLFEYFLARRNQGKSGKDRLHLVVIGATSGDTGSAAIYGLRGKEDTSIFILHPKGKVSAIQEAQMTTVLDPNVHNLSVQGSFDDCQAMVKSMFADPEMNLKYKLASVNSINWARILAQMTYYIHSYFSLTRSPKYAKDKPIRFVVPSGNFGDILAGWFAKQMGLLTEKLVIATNENDILDRFWKTGQYTKKPAGNGTTGAEPSGVKETFSPAMDILVSSNFERLLWFLALKVFGGDGDIPLQRQRASDIVRRWLGDLQTQGGFSVEPAVLDAAKEHFESERVSDLETIDTIRDIYSSCFPASPVSSGTRGSTGGYILDPHSAVGVAASLRSIDRNPGTHHISLSTAHPAKFVSAVDMALGGQDGYKFDNIVPPEFAGLLKKERRVIEVPAGEGWKAVSKIIDANVKL